MTTKSRDPGIRYLAAAWLGFRGPRGCAKNKVFDTVLAGLVLVPRLVAEIEPHS